MCVEEVGHEGQIELWISGDEGSGRQELATLKLVSIVQYLLGSL